MSHRNACAGKLRFDRASAVYLARQLHRNHDENVNAYRCRYCAWWHLGHSTKRPRPIKKRRRALDGAA